MENKYTKGTECVCRYIFISRCIGYRNNIFQTFLPFNREGYSRFPEFLQDNQ